MKTYTAQPYGCKVTLYTDAAVYERRSGYSVEGCAGLTGWMDGHIAMFVGDNSLATLVHECTHAVLYILEYVGIEPLSSNGEPMAYLMDSMFTALSGEFEWL